MKELYTEKLNQAIKYMEEENIDTWLIYSSEGSDVSINLLFGIRTVGKTFFVINRNKEIFSICSNIDAQESQDSNLFTKVIIYGQDGPKEELNNLLKKINPNKIAINFSEFDNLCDGLTYGRYLWLLENLGEELSSKFISSENMLSKIRAIKSSKEIEYIKKAVDITEEIFKEVFNEIQVGMSEYEVGQLFVEGMVRHNVSDNITKTLEMPLVMNGDLAHRAPSKERIIKKGDFLIMDFGVDYNGYVSDISRTAYILKDDQTDAPEKFKTIFKAAYDGITIAFNTVKPHIQGFMVDKAVRTFYLDNNLPGTTHATGHQIGRNCHDGGALFAPLWERYKKGAEMVIEEGMTFTLEPTIFNVNGFCVLLEEDIVITKEGAEFLSTRQEQLILIR